MYRMTDEEFETAIAEALDAMPEQFMEALNNVAIVWEEEPSAYHVGYDEEWDIEPAFVEDEDGPKAHTSAASTAARKSWKRSARPSSMSWATTSALTRTSWPPWATSKGAG